MTERDPSTIFVVIPVFNRIDATARCLDDLRRQTYPRVHIIVVDGGSTDDTVERLSAEGDVELIAGVGEQWWTGATWFGIESALRQGTDNDFVMLLNNDTSFGPDMLAVLVAESRRLGAAVAPIARDSDGSVVNGGVWIDWSAYDITQGKSDPASGVQTWPVDALEGRGTLVPIRAVRAAGNVDPVRLPHYAADYEFSLRLARHGCPLMMTNGTSIAVHWDLATLRQYSDRASLARLWWETTSQLSFANLRTHLTLIDLAAPAQVRRKLKVKVVVKRFGQIPRRTKMRDLPGMDTLLAFLDRNRPLTVARREVVTGPQEAPGREARLTALP
jgi:GT2 family glycosyltransferase